MSQINRTRKKLTLKGEIENTKLYLQGYAMQILKDKIVAKKLVEKILSTQFESQPVVISDRFLIILKADLINHYYYLKQSQIFDRPLIKIPLIKFDISPTD